MTILIAIIILTAVNWFAKSDILKSSIEKAIGGESHRDSVIKNWQKRIANTEECIVFRELLKEAGQKHKSAASGKFVMDMNKAMESAKKANCVTKP